MLLLLLRLLLLRRRRLLRSLLLLLLLLRVGRRGVVGGDRGLRFDVFFLREKKGKKVVRSSFLLLGGDESKKLPDG